MALESIWENKTNCAVAQCWKLIQALRFSGAVVKLDHGSGIDLVRQVLADLGSQAEVMIESGVCPLAKRKEARLLKEARLQS